MRREQRLTGGKRFSAIHEADRGRANRLLVVKCIPNGLDTSCFGFLVGKRTGGAVTRNKIKRRLREIVRQAAVKPGWDVVLIARRGAAGADYHKLAVAVRELLLRSRLLQTLEELSDAPDIARGEAHVSGVTTGLTMPLGQRRRAG